MPRRSLALLIDAENLPSSCAHVLMSAVAHVGDPVVRRAYGDWSQVSLGGWLRTLAPLAIQPVQQAAGKNAADIAMVIDAMDLLHLGHHEVFALASNDADLTRLALRLREAGKEVLAVGTNPGAAFRAACSQTVRVTIQAPVLAQPTTPAPPSIPASPAAVKASSPPPLRDLLIQAMGEAGALQGCLLQSLGVQLRTVHPGFNHKDYGAASLSKLLSRQDYLEVTGKGTAMRVRLTQRHLPPAQASRPRAPLRQGSGSSLASHGKTPGA